MEKFSAANSYASCAERIAQVRGRPLAQARGVRLAIACRRLLSPAHRSKWSTGPFRSPSGEPLLTYWGLGTEGPTGNAGVAGFAGADLTGTEAESRIELWSRPLSARM